MGYKCPDCKAEERGEDPSRGRAAADAFQRPGSSLRGWRPGGSGSGGTRGASAAGDRTPLSVNVRATVIGAIAAVAGGFLMAPILVGGLLFLISAGVIGWLVARSVYWASEERNSPYLRGAALGLSALTVIIGIAQASGMSELSEIVYLALPAGVYGGWIVVRQR